MAAGALAAALLLAGLLAVFPDPDPDVWWHLKTGEVIVAQHTIPRTDIFSYTAAGRPWVTHEWLSEVILYGVHRWVGDDGLVLFKALLVVVALGMGACAALIGPRARERLAPAALGVLLAAPLLTVRAFARPHLFTAALLGALLVLLRLESATGRRLFRLALVPLFALWANLHSGFVLGLSLTGLYWVGEALSARSSRALPAGGRPKVTAATVKDRPTVAPPHLAMRLRWLLLLFLATLLNPHHVNSILYPVRLLLEPGIRNSILELRPLFHVDHRGALFLWDFLLLVIVTSILLWGTRRRLAWALLLPAVAFGLIGVRAVRGLAEFAVLVPALIAAHGQWLARRRRVVVGLAIGVTLLAGVGAGTWLRSGLPMGREGARRAGFGLSGRAVPDQAVLFLRGTPAQGRLFNILGYGGYLIHELWPERQVFIDGRLDVYAPEFLDAYGRLLSTGAGWERICDEHGITLALVDYRSGPTGDYGLRRKLRSAPDWSCVFLSHNAIVYARDVPENQALLARFACSLDPARLSVESIRDYVETTPRAEVEGTISALTAMTEVAPRDPFLLVILGQLLDATGRSAEGAARIREALAIGPESVEARLLLASALTRAGLTSEARVELERLSTITPRRVEVLVFLAEVQRREGNTDGARETLRRALSVQPENESARKALEALEQ